MCQEVKLVQGGVVILNRGQSADVIFVHVRGIRNVYI